MPKILHFSIHKTVPEGVLNQLIDEQYAVQQFEEIIDWSIKLFSHDKLEPGFCTDIPSSTLGGTISKLVEYIRLRKVAYCWLKNNTHLYDAILMRYRSGDIFQNYYSKGLTNIFTVHHTIEIQEARARGNIIGYLEAYAENILGPMVLERAKGIIGVTPEILSYEQSRIKNNKPTFCHPNGILLSRHNILPDNRDGVLKLLFVSSLPAIWHGVDILTDNLSKTQNNFELHIVGNFDKNEYVSDKRFIFHGTRDNQYINALASSCDIGLGSFALERKGLTQACTLKVREYLAQGLPVFSGHIDSGLPKDFPFYIKEKPEADKILAFAESCKNLSRDKVRNAAAPYIDKLELMRKLYSWIKTVIN